jgi:hypothetical protein
MSHDDVDAWTDLAREDLDPDWFASALAVQHIRQVIVHGGSPAGWWRQEEVVHPSHLQRFVSRAARQAEAQHRFEREWQQLEHWLPAIQRAWEKGKLGFGEDLLHAESDAQDLEYLSQIDFASDCYACASSRRAYPQNVVLQAWYCHGYLTAWREHFVPEEESN